MNNEKQKPILFLEPVFKKTIWGGGQFRERFGYQVSEDHIGECWAISAHPNGDCVVKNGVYAGMTLSELWKQHPELFGGLSGDKFPLLVKMIDTQDDLSIQVHPDDAYAQKYENGSLGKAECWYVLDCGENASLIIGHHARTREELREMILQGRWDELLREIPIKKGDFIQNDPGTMHAIRGGIMVLETQQNSDITYRVYDYDRLTEGKPRPLHVEQSIDVITVPATPLENSIKNTDDLKENRMNELISCTYYTVWELQVVSQFILEQRYPFLNVSVTDGEGVVNGQRIRKGDHFILPSDIGEVDFQGQMEMILSTSESAAAEKQEQ